jgi:nitrite reductase/ring-hydroxylating ferredoxin subunit
MLMVWKRTISAKALEKAKSAAVKIEDKVIFIANINGKLYAMDAVCSHARCILGFLDEEKLTVKCPCHHAVFNLNGNMLEPPYVAPDAPKEKMGLKVYQIRDNNGWIEVDI